MATATQVVLQAKKNKLKNRSKWFAFGQIDRSFKLWSFCGHLFNLRIIE